MKRFTYARKGQPPLPYLNAKSRILSPDDWMTIAELVNPGAIVPEQSQLFADGELLGNVIIDCGDNVNRYCSRADFQLIQNALSGTGVDYTIEFVLDEVPNVAGEIGVAHDVPPKPARKTKAAAKSVKGEGKAKAVEEVTEPAEKPGTKVKKVIPAPSKAVAPPPTARPRSISIAAKAGPSTQPAAILPSRQKRGLATAPRRETLNSVIADAECVGQKRQRFTEHDAKEPPAQKKRALRKP
ncbi:hypothetical protein DFH08DRAFT_891495 [Mycena albidolilacea]|uniref:Uncharacterized protein n=1 Tax=Mycena albidolilacea TaxID=1033008 RepID=A0AAD7EFL1_9AGAR|nr:hypothetical protein DFH08DRAFT_891495 [Mycena albidolilacea]